MATGDDRRCIAQLPAKGVGALLRCDLHRNEGLPDRGAAASRADRAAQGFGGRSLLDVGCGTGLHLEHLRRWYVVEGIDVDPAMLEIARGRLPGVPLHQADMADFDLGRGFDVILCLFGAIGYVRTLSRLRCTLRTMRRHILPGGVLILEPFLTPEAYRPGLIHAVFVDQPDLKLARMNIARLGGRLSILDFHFQVATPGGVRHFVESHRLGLFTHEEYLHAIRAAGLDVSHDPTGLTGRGLYVGVNG